MVFLATLFCEITFSSLKLQCLIFNDFYLRIKNKALALNLQGGLCRLSHFTIKVFLHLCILSFKHADMLVWALLVVEHATDTRLFLIFDHLLLENFELECHKVDLLLQIDNIVVSCIFVWILSNYTRCALILSTELHLMHWVVVCVVSKCLYAASSWREVSSFTNAASTYLFIKTIG